MLAQTDSVANWVAAIGQCLGAVGTFAAVVVALRLARRDRRDRDAAQARLVTITVDYPEYGDPSQYVVPRVRITNYSERPVRPPVRWGHKQTIYDEYSLHEVLPGSAEHLVPFEHFTADGLPIDTTVTPGRIKEFDDVTITFIDAAGLRWRRTGNGEPVRVVQPAQRTEPSGPRCLTALSALMTSEATRPWWNT